MTDWDLIWRSQDEIRTVVDAALGECVWNLCYSQDRNAIELELIKHLDEETVSTLCAQFSTSADYDGEGKNGTKLVFFL